MLQSVDIAVAFHAARGGPTVAWKPKVAHEELGIPWSSLHLSLGRLRAAGVVRGNRVSLQALALLLPTLRYLVPIGPSSQERVIGVPTGASSPGLQGKLVVGVPLVWPSERGDVVGMPVRPLFRTVPEAALASAELHALYGALDAARMGRARELRLAREVLVELLGLPQPMLA